MSTETKQPQTSPAVLRRAEAAQRRLEASIQTRDEAIVDAYTKGGVSLRAIEAATSLNHETIRTILRRAGVDTTKAAKRAKKETKR